MIDIEQLAKKVPEWKVVGGKHLARTFTFPDFATALAFVNAAGAIAEALDHHPDVQLSWGKVHLEITTHDAGGLTEKDFTFAERVDRVPRG